MLFLTEALSDPSAVGCICLRFKGQKNGENDEKKIFVRNTKNPSRICFAANLMQILKRHKHLTKTNPELPLSVYRNSAGRTRNIISALVEIFMRKAAAHLFNLDPVENKAEHQMQSAHSLRVGAYTTLYAMDFYEIEIKHLLRWKSNAFMTYLQNLAVTSRRLNDAISNTSCIPNFL